MRLLLGNNEFIDPTQIEDAVAMGGYEALGQSVLKMTPEEVISEIKSLQAQGKGGPDTSRAGNGKAAGRAAGRAKICHLQLR